MNIIRPFGRICGATFCSHNRPPGSKVADELIKAKWVIKTLDNGASTNGVWSAVSQGYTKPFGWCPLQIFLIGKTRRPPDHQRTVNNGGRHTERVGLNNNKENQYFERMQLVKQWRGHCSCTIDISLNRLRDKTTEFKMYLTESLISHILEECNENPMVGVIAGCLKHCRELATDSSGQGEEMMFVRACRHATHANDTRFNKNHPWATRTSGSPRGHGSLVFQNYFPKWVEIVPLKNVMTRKFSQHFIGLLLWSGVPETLVIDNGKHYTAKVFRQGTDEWKVDHQFTPPYSPQSKPAERPNRIIRRWSLCTLIPMGLARSIEWFSFSY